MSNEIPVVFHSGSNYDYRSIVKELTHAFEKQFECLGEDINKCKTFFIPIEKKVPKIDQDDNESVATISNKIIFIDNARYVPSSLPNLVDNLAKGINKIKCRECDGFLEYESVKDNLIKKINAYLAIKIVQARLMKN